MPVEKPDAGEREDTHSKLRLRRNDCGGEYRFDGKRHLRGNASSSYSFGLTAGGSSLPSVHFLLEKLGQFYRLFIAEGHKLAGIETA
jgi:hypothetical protein